MLNIDKIKEQLVDSDLPKNEREELIEMFALGNDADLEPLTKLFEEDQKWIRIIADNYKEKKAAFKNKDPLRLEDIIKSEELLLVKLAHEQ